MSTLIVDQNTIAINKPEVTMQSLILISAEYFIISIALIVIKHIIVTYPDENNSLIDADISSTELEILTLIYR